MQINKAILTIFDYTSSLVVYSDNLLPVGEPYVQDYISTHVAKALGDPGVRTGTLDFNSPMGQLVKQYIDGAMDLSALSKEWAERTFTYMKQDMDPILVDGIVCEATGENTYLCFLQCEARNGVTHQLFSEEDGSLSAELIEYKAVLPSPTQKLRAFVSVRLSDGAIRMYEPKGTYDGEVTYVQADKVFTLHTTQSSRDTVRKVKSIVNKVCEAHESDGVQAMTKTKALLAKQAEVSPTVDPMRIVEEVFDNPVQQQAAKDALAEEHMDKPLPMHAEYAMKQGEVHKIKTDTGIEITFPVSYMNKREFLEIVTNDDGTLRIELKNINKIMNK